MHIQGIAHDHAAKDSDGTALHTLSSGEDLDTVANRFGVSRAQLLAQNPHILHAALIGPGDTLQIPLAHIGSSENHHSQLGLGAVAQSTTDLPPVVVTPSPQPEFPPFFPEFPPWNPEPPPIGGGGGGGAPAPITEATSLEDIADLLGEEVAEIINKSPALKAALEALFSQNWTVELGNVSEARLQSSQIIISAGQNAEGTIATLAHEIGHAMHGEQFDWSSLTAFVDSGLLTEAEGAFVNLQVRSELASQGIHIPILTSDPAATHSQYIEAWNDYQQDGNRQQAISTLVEIFRQHESTASGVPYVQFYTDYFNSQQNPAPPPPGGGGGGGGEPTPPIQHH